MFFNEPAKDAEGVAEYKKEVDDLIGQCGYYEKFTQEDHGGDGGPHSCLHRWIGRDVLGYGAISIGEGFLEMVFFRGRDSEVA